MEHGLAITLEYFTTAADQARALDILQFKLDILWSLLDSLTMAYSHKTPPFHTVTDQQVWHRGL